MTANINDTTAARIDGRAVKIVGLGGIGAPVAQAMTQYLFRRSPGSTLWLIDGDDYEESNRDRVLFHAGNSANKALAKAQELTVACRGALCILPVPEYVTPRTAAKLIRDRDIVFLCVDNHATRKLVSNRCRRLSDVLVISGGNDGVEKGKTGTFGNVQIYERFEGRDCTNPLTRFHPEIARPRDRRPDELGCAAMLPAAPQLLFTNLAVAAAMLASFHNWLNGLEYEEVFLDIRQARMAPAARSFGRTAAHQDAQSRFASEPR
jgi:hypothetical protein